MDDAELVAETAAASSALIARLAAQGDVVAGIIDAIRRTLGKGHTIFTCGNGGSAAEALHLSEELIGRYKADRPPYRAVCLSADPTALTCIANDFGFDRVFERQVEGLARAGDVVVVLSTSGNSPNIVRALESARRMGVTTIGLLGKSGGACRELCDHALVVDSDATERIQEVHLVVVHQILEALERGASA